MDPGLDRHAGEDLLRGADSRAVGRRAGLAFSHAQVFRARIVNNTFIGHADGVGFGQSDRLPPVDVTFANNLVGAHAGRVMNMVLTPTRPVYEANIVDPQGTATAGISGPAFRVVDPRLARTGELLKLADGSPAVDTGSVRDRLGLDLRSRPSRRCSPSMVGGAVIPGRRLCAGTAGRRGPMSFGRRPGLHR